MRTYALVAAAAAALLALAGCSGSAAPTASPTPVACSLTAPGAQSDAVSVSGDFDTHPTATFPLPTTTDITQRTVVTTGSGAVAGTGLLATVDFTLFNATSGAELFTTLKEGGQPLPITVDESQFLPGLVKAVSCATVGSRIVAVVPPGDAYGTSGNADLGVAATDSLVFVVDVKDVGPVPEVTPSPTLDPNTPTRATGADQPAVAGFPTVVLAADGTPSVTVPAVDPPSTLQIAQLKKGTGATVAAGDSVTVQYQGLIWRTGMVFNESWGNKPATFLTSAVIPGFTQALVGQAVGSQVIVIIPPDQGYGTAGQASAGITGTDTLVFVIDILATTTP